LTLPRRPSARASQAIVPAVQIGCPACSVNRRPSSAAAVAPDQSPSARAGSQLDPGSGHLVRGVVPAIRRVLIALLDNAISHTPDNGHIQVEITGDPRGHP
jgi:signal transduction histidine kinase